MTPPPPPAEPVAALMRPAPQLRDSKVNRDLLGVMLGTSPGYWGLLLLTILFVLIVRVVDSVLAIVVLFELAYSLITERAPSDRVVRWADRVVRYERG